MGNEANKSQKNADALLWDLPLDRKKIYSCLRDFVRWAFNRQGHTALEQFEKDLADFENHIRGSIETGTLSEEEADESRGNHIWFIAREVTKELPRSLALWGLPLMISFDDSEFEKKLAERRNVIEGEFKRNYRSVSRQARSNNGMHPTADTLLVKFP